MVMIVLPDYLRLLMTGVRASPWVNSIRYAVPIRVTSDVLSLITLFHLGLCARFVRGRLEAWSGCEEGKEGMDGGEDEGDVSLC